MSSHALRERCMPCSGSAGMLTLAACWLLSTIGSVTWPMPGPGHYRMCMQASNVFAGKHGLITPRDLFRWAERGAENYLQLAQHGYMLLAERLRSPGEAANVQDSLQRILKVQVGIWTSSLLTACHTAHVTMHRWHVKWVGKSWSSSDVGQLSKVATYQLFFLFCCQSVTGLVVSCPTSIGDQHRMLPQIAQVLQASLTGLGHAGLPCCLMLPMSTVISDPSWS